jgi:hypothetical protein
MSGLVGGAVVPAAPLMLTSVSPDQPAEVREGVTRLRSLAREAIASLPTADVCVLVAAGIRGIYDRAHANLGPLGVIDATVDLPVAETAIEQLSRLTQYPVFRGDDLGLGLSVLALQLHEVHGDIPVLALHVPPTAHFDVLVSVGASINEALTETGLTGVIIAAGDLSAGLGERSPAYAIEGAARWDEAVVTAARTGTFAELGSLGPEEAERVKAVGWPALAVVHGACAASQFRLEVLDYASPRGVGQLVARCVADGDRSSA